MHSARLLLVPNISYCSWERYVLHHLKKLSCPTSGGIVYMVGDSIGVCSVQQSGNHFADRRCWAIPNFPYLRMKS